MNTAQPPHTGLIVQRTGLRITEENPFLGASAPSITVCECHGKRVVEIKCPFSFRNKNLEEFLNDQRCCIEGLTLKKGHKYFAQVQLQMFVFNSQYCDFFVWTLNFSILCIIQRDEEFIQQMIVKSAAFFKNHILPELVTRRLENKNDGKTENQDSISA